MLQFSHVTERRVAVRAIGFHHRDHDDFAVILPNVDRFAITGRDGNVGTPAGRVLRETG
jgi:hypothetical protein